MKETQYCTLCPLSNWWNSTKNKLGVVTCCIIALAFIALVVGFFVHDFFTCTGTLIATAAITYQSHQFTLVNNRENSKFYLEKYIQASNMILERLKSDSPTRRIAWISSAAIANKNRSIKIKITEEVDKDFLEISERNFPHMLHGFILEKASHYFYGVDGAENLEEAFNKCGINGSNLAEGLVPKWAPLTYVDRDSIKAIIDFTKDIWEKEVGHTYKDDEEFLNVLSFNYGELYKYLKYLIDLENRQKR